MSAPTSRGAPQPDRRRRWRWPAADSRFGAVLYAVIGGLLVYLLVDVLPHLHIAISYHR